MRGLHVMVDLHGCTSASLRVGEDVRTQARELCAEAGLTVVGESHHAFAGGGYTFALLLAESHVALHTWPELGCATMDVYVCNFSRNNDGVARELVSKIVTLFSPRNVARNEVMRGEESTDIFERLSSKNTDFAPQV
jgi:S-adenosylmethionine decarboxylase proenzyme